MASNIKQHSPLAVAYARSLLELAIEQNVAEPVGAELAQLRQVVVDHDDVRRFFESPGIGEADRAGVLDRAISKSASPLVGNFLKVLNQRDALRSFIQIASAYQSLLDTHLGKVDVQLTVAVRLGDNELENVRRRIGTALGKDPVVHQQVDDSIIGGMILQVEDRIIDASVRRQLQTMKDQLVQPATA